ncbi:YfaZ precursor [Raoultella terrigena]|uniref:YfaZ n=1 Tax=Raoultella terrigena TaxID=577 RepID=A0A4U9D110_RAOTE|nr:YfaZ precursor [Raoultella terrigena]
MSMFTSKSVLLVAALCASGAASASVNLHGEAGEEFTHLSASFNADDPGMTFNGSWAHSDNDGDIAGLGMGYNFDLGPFLLTMGAKRSTSIHRIAMRVTPSRLAAGHNYRSAISSPSSGRPITLRTPCPAA